MLGTTGLPFPRYNGKKSLEWRRASSELDFGQVSSLTLGDIGPPSTVETFNGVPSLSTSRQCLNPPDAYNGPPHSIPKDFALTSNNANTVVTDIKEGLVRIFLRAAKTSGHDGPLRHRISFQIDWNLRAFIRDRGYKNPIRDDLGRIITLTGWSRNVQATTCLEYMRQAWPLTGTQILQFLNEMLQDGDHNGRTCKLPRNITLTARLSEDHLDIIADGTILQLAELGEQFAWLGAAVRSSPVEFGVAYCKPFASLLGSRRKTPSSHVSHEEPRSEFFVKIGFTFEIAQESDEVSGCCWHSLFTNPVVVKGYPIPERPGPDTGLEISLGDASKPVGANGVSLCSETLLIKSVDVTLIPTGYSDNVVFWHVISNKSNSVMLGSGFKPQRFVRSFLRGAGRSLAGNLREIRHIIGWCPKVKNYIGSPYADYHIKWSRLPTPPRGNALENVTVSGGKFSTASASSGVGGKDKPVQIRSTGEYVTRLRWLSSKYVVFYDVEDRRAWLVNGVSALLHLVRASLDHERRGSFSHLLLIGEIHEATSARTGQQASIEVLTNETNLALPLYLVESQVTEETTTHSDGTPSSIKQRQIFTFRDRVVQIRNILEQIVSNQEDIQSAKGVGYIIRNSSRRLLEGFDFMDIAACSDHITLRMTTLIANGRTWVDFIRSIHAITLFGRGFGELLTPAETETIGQFSDNNSRCPRVPKGSDYLVAPVPELQAILRTRGSVYSNPWQLVDNIYWYAPEEPFEPSASGRQTSENSIPVQVLLPASFLKGLQRQLKSPSKLSEEGAVVFGGKTAFQLKWPQNREPDWQDTISAAHHEHDSGIGTSISSRSRPGSPSKSGFLEIAELGTTPSQDGDPDSAENRASQDTYPFLSMEWHQKVRDGLWRLVQKTFLNSHGILRIASTLPVGDDDGQLLLKERICRLLEDLTEGVRHDSDHTIQVKVARILETFKRPIAHLIANPMEWPTQVFPLSFITSLPDEDKEILTDLEEPRVVDALSNVVIMRPEYAVFVQRLNDLASPTFISDALEMMKCHQTGETSSETLFMLNDILSELYYTKGPIRDFQVIDFEDPTKGDYIKTLVENFSGGSWDWWPLSQPKRPLKHGEARIQWECRCGKSRSANVPRWFAHGISDLLGKYLYNQRSPPRSGTGDSTGSGIGFDRSAVAGEDTNLLRDTTTNPPTGNEAYPLADLNEGTDNGLSISLIPNEERWIFFLVKSNRYNLAQGDAQAMTSIKFWRFLQEQYKQLRGLRWLFSIYVFHYCDFVLIERWRPSRFSPGNEFQFPPVGHTEYTYFPKPIRPRPPISIHEFEENFHGCYESTCFWCRLPFSKLWSIMRLCNRIDDIPPDKVKMIPKRDRRVATTAAGHSETFWGMVARERKSFFRVCVYVMLILLPTFIFGSGWLVGWFGEHSGDLQNATVPAVLVLSLLALLWALFI